jgi:hypothetical protein
MAHEDWKEVVRRAEGGARVFFGYLIGAKLYLTPDLDEYIEIPDGQIIHEEELDEDVHPLGGSYVWIKKAARLRRVGRSTVEGEADFLRGVIEAEHRAQAELRAGWHNPQTGLACTQATFCNPCISHSPCGIGGGGWGDPSPI